MAIMASDEFFLREQPNYLASSSKEREGREAGRKEEGKRALR